MGPIEPSYAAFVDLANYRNVVPVTRELAADSFTPPLAFACVGSGLGSYLLERGDLDDDARYSWVGFDPELCVRGLVDRYEEQHADGLRVQMASDPYAALRQTLADYQPAPAPWLPTTWLGAVGYVSPRAQRAGAAAPGGGSEPLFAFSIAATQLLFDHRRHSLRVIVPVRIDRHEDLRDTYAAALLRLDRAQQRLSQSLPLQAQSQSAPARIDRAAQLDCQPGEVDSVVAASEERSQTSGAISRSLRLPSSGVDVFDVYCALRRAHTAPYTCFLRFAQQRVIGLSREWFDLPPDGTPAIDRDRSGIFAVLHDALDRPYADDEPVPRTAAESPAAHGGAPGWIAFDPSAHWAAATRSVIEGAGELSLQASVRANTSRQVEAARADARRLLETLVSAIALARRAGA
jgi:anthranilate synthase component 1